MKRRGAGLASLATVFLVLLSPVAVSQSNHPTSGYTEAEIKAAFITHLFSFVRWPNGRQPALICSLGGNAVTDKLRGVLKAKSQLGVELRELQPAAPDLDECDALYLAAGLGEVDALNLPAGVLTISDTQSFATDGGMIELERRPSRVGLVVNRTALNAAGFSVSSQLLALARIVTTEGLENGGA